MQNDDQQFEETHIFLNQVQEVLAMINLSNYIFQ